MALENSNIGLAKPDITVGFGYETSHLSRDKVRVSGRRNNGKEDDMVIPR